ncbi:MAG: MMPL family transporter [Deltaproteobacteria bacterium]|nr:MMPL family transporter [Deltaproteobacteria bacterium]
MRARAWEWIVVALTVASLIAVAFGLRLSPDVSALLPDAGEGASLRVYARAFGGGDLAMVLVRGEDPERVRWGAQTATEALRGCPEVRAALDHIEVGASSDPTLAWAHASPGAQRALAEALTPKGMDERLADSRALLLGPGASAIASMLQKDPLRLAQLPSERGMKVGEGASASSPGLLSSAGGLVASEGKARLVVVVPSGSALRGSEARRFVDAVEARLAPLRGRAPELRFDLTGGHAIAAATEAMIRRDLYVSGTASMLLASIAFALMFRRVRALLAVLPPLALGTLWTAAIAGTVFGEISSIAVAFVSVVVGVGVDTGVHVYSALLSARAQGLDAAEAARKARATMARPTLLAALAAAAAFASLGLSRVAALRQFGWLCAAGELLTAAAILIVTPWIGAWLERGPAPGSAAGGWPRLARKGIESRAAPWILAASALVPLVVLAGLGLPRLAPAVLSVRPSALAPIQTQNEIFSAFGGGGGQWVVMVDDANADIARARADAIADRLSSSSEHIASMSSLSELAPSTTTQRARLRERDALDLPGKIGLLREALVRAGFAADRFEAAFEAMRAPSQRLVDVLEAQRDESVLLRARFLAQEGSRWIAAVYVLPRAGHEASVESMVAAVDPAARITGYSRLDRALRANLAHDLPLMAGAALVLVALAMAGAMRGVRDGMLAAGTLLLELAWVLAAARVLDIRIHAYNALVLPVLIGVTIDEAMFLLHRAKKCGAGETLEREARNVSTTALTTAAGFAALITCRFEGLADLGRLGTLGVVAGLVAALMVVPTGLRLWAASGSRRVAP